MRKQLKGILLLIVATALTPLAGFAADGEEVTKLLGVQLGKETTLRDVEKRLGKSRIVETGEAGEYKATVCYYVPKCQTKVEFWSSELGGQKHDVIGFTLTRTAKNDRACPALNTSCKDLQTPNGIHLGMQKEEFTKKLQGGVELVEGFYQKGFESRKPMTAKERQKIGVSDNALAWDIVVFVRGAFSRGGLDILEVSRSQTF